MAQQVTDLIGNEVGAVVALEHQRCAVFGEEADQGSDGGVRVGMVAWQCQQHAAGGQFPDAEQVRKLTIDGDGWFGVVDGPDGAETRPGAGAVGQQAIIAVTTPAMEGDEAREFALRQAGEMLLERGHADGVAPEVHEVVDLPPLGRRGDGRRCTEQRGRLGDGVAPATERAHGQSDGVGHGGVIDATPSGPASDGERMQAQPVFAVTASALERWSTFQVAGRATFAAFLCGFTQQVGMASGASFVWRWWMVDMMIGRRFITGVFLAVVQNGWSCQRPRVLRATWRVPPAPGVR